MGHCNVETFTLIDAPELELCARGVGVATL